MERMLNEDITTQVKDVLAENLLEPVKILFFEDDEHCDFCAQTRQILEEIVPLDSRLSLEVKHLHGDAKIAKQYHVDKAPGIVLAAKNAEEIVDYGIRFYGIPAGHEFTSLINDVILVSSRESGLSPATKAFLKKNKEDILLQVFTTPT